MSAAVRHSLVIDARGGVSTVYDDALTPLLRTLGVPATLRASHVEPIMGDALGRWEVDLSPLGGPRYCGPFDTRGLALAFERRWVEQQLRLDAAACGRAGA